MERNVLKKLVYSAIVIAIVIVVYNVAIAIMTANGISHELAKAIVRITGIVTILEFFART